MSEQLLEERVGKRLRALGATIATAESCCGGLISHRITNVSGSSDYFSGGIVSYSNDSKLKMLDVEKTSLEKYGAVSDIVAIEMAQGARRAFLADYAVSVTGIAGPTGGSDDKPVGLVYVGVASPSGIRVERCVFEGDRDQVKLQTADKALSLLLEVAE
jgi:PncC family amidohydrolase